VSLEPYFFNSEELLAVLAQSKDATAIYTTEDLIIQTANDAMIGFWGKDRSVIGKPFEEAVPELTGQPFFALMRKVWRTGITYQAKDTAARLRVNGQLQWFFFDFEYKAIKDKQGEIYCILHTATNVTERHSHQQIVTYSKERESQLNQELADADEELASVNEELRINNENLAATNEALIQSQENLRKLNSELEERVNARTREVLTAKSEAWAQQAMLAAIIQYSEDAIISKTLDGIITSWNQAAEKLFGHTANEAIGKHISIVIPMNRMEEERLIIEKIRNNETIDHFETIRQTKTGEEIPISLTVSPIRDTNGAVIGASKIVRDISRQRQAEQRLQSYAESLETLNSIGQTISADLDMQGILQKVTDATTQLTGASFGAFFHNLVNEQGESYMLYTLSGAPREAFEKFGMPRNTALFDHTFSGLGVVRVDDITKDPRYGKNAPHYGMPKGHLPVVSYMAVPVISKNGTVLGGFFFGHQEPAKFTKEHEQLIANVAAQAAVALDNAKLYEEIRVLNARKDEFIGLASHELKTPVTSINGYLQIIERNMPPENRDKHFIAKALIQVNKLSGLISDLLDVSKIQTGKLPFSYTLFNLSQVLADVTEMMQYSYSNHIIQLQVEPELMLHADQQRIEQVIINLITNAIKYSPGAREIVITAAASGKKIKVGVQDFGIGIASDQQEKVFNRFYRVENLAAHMSGLGIGLYICYEIIKRHKGRMWVQSALHEGSTFFFELPTGELRSK
jgi:PAS domain S-box-containing protein